MPSLSFQKGEVQGRQNFSPLKNPGSVLSETEGQESRSETEVLRMQENSETTRDRQLDEEHADVLIAISVIAKRLGRKLQTANQEGGTPNGENERPGLTDLGAALLRGDHHRNRQYAGGDVFFPGGRGYAVK